MAGKDGVIAMSMGMLNLKESMPLMGSGESMTASFDMHSANGPEMKMNEETVGDFGVIVEHDPLTMPITFVTMLDMVASG